VQDIYWIAGSGNPSLAIVPRPRGDEWLEDEMMRMRRNGVDAVVSLLEPFEAEWLGLSEEKQAAEDAGLQFLNFPIRDTRVPADVAAFRAFVKGLAARIANGERIGVHCRGCIGRATITAACTLMHMGWDAQSALAAIMRARGVPVPDTPEQEQWILGYKADV